MAKKKGLSKLKQALFVGSGTVSGGLSGVPIGKETAVLKMGEILSAEQMANPMLVNLATDVIVGSSVAGGITSGLFSGLALLALYKTGKIHLPPKQARKLKRLVSGLEREAKEAGHDIEKFVGHELHRIREVI